MFELLGNAALEILDSRYGLLAALPLATGLAVAFSCALDRGLPDAANTDPSIPSSNKKDSRHSVPLANLG